MIKELLEISRTYGLDDTRLRVWGIRIFHIVWRAQKIVMYSATDPVRPAFSSISHTAIEMEQQLAIGRHSVDARMVTRNTDR